MENFYIKIDELIDHWGGWEEDKDYYIQKLLPELKGDFSKGDEKEVSLLTEIKKITDKKDWNNLEKIVKKRSENRLREKEILEKIEKCLDNFDFNNAKKILNEYPGAIRNNEFKEISKIHIDKIKKQTESELKKYNFRKANNLYKNIGEFYPLKKYQELKRYYQIKKDNGIKDQIKKRLQEDKLKEANILYRKIKNIYPLKKYQQLKEEYLKKKKREEILKKMEVHLGDCDFIKADRLFFRNQCFSKNEYENLKTEYVQKDLEKLTKKIGLPFDKEKATVLATTGQYVLVRARAGSGKTTAVALKVRQLIKYYGAKPEEILVLAFSKKAAKEFRERINKYCQDEIVDKTNSSTFHSLAYRLVNPGEQLLFNDLQDNSEFIRGQQSEFIGKIFNQILDEKRGIILTLLYNFFKALAKEKISADFDSKGDFYLYRKNLYYVSLGGERVKSKGEKFIADFLFEHKIFKNGQELEYKYEWNLPGGIRRYKPDFSFWPIVRLEDKMPYAILEHFGITQRHPADRTYMSEKEEQDYKDEIKWKKEYCEQKNILFLSTSVDDFVGTTETGERAQFEQILAQRLKTKGFVLQKLNQEEIIKRILEAEANLNQLFDQITQFINRAKKQLLNPSDIQSLAEGKSATLGERAKNFIKIVRRVYERYQNRLKEENKIDFDDLLLQAVKKIRQSNGSCELEIFGERRPIKSIKYILIDEYQDFSKLFYQLINAIRQINPAVSVFCVGDDWQAINGFAGSDLEYFTNFKNYFATGRRTSLLTNHRSFTDIVNHSNLVMFGRGNGGRPEGNKPLGEIYLSSVLYVEWRVQQEYQAEYHDDKKYRDGAKSMGCWRNKEMKVSRHLKTIEKIVQDNSSKEICLLFRTNKFYGVNIEKFKDKIKEWCPREKKIICSTTHSYKGKESEVIVIVDANKKSYPKIHPDNELMELLGVTLSKVIEEERRLFYVAITRAKEKLYLIYEEDTECSDFIPKKWSKFRFKLN